MFRTRILLDVEIDDKLETRRRVLCRETAHKLWGREAAVLNRVIFDSDWDERACRWATSEWS